MLKCKDISRQASDYQDKVLPLGTRLQFGLHLLICGKCRLFMAHMRAVTKVYQGVAAKELEQSGAEHLAAAIVKQAAFQQTSSSAGSTSAGSSPAGSSPAGSSPADSQPGF